MAIRTLRCHGIRLYLDGFRPSHQRAHRPSHPPRLCPMPCRASLRPLLVSANAYSVWLHLLWHFRHNASPSNCNQNTDDMGFLLHLFKTGNSFALLRMLLSCRCGNKTTWLQAPQNIGPIMVGSCWDGNNSIRCDPL